MTVMAGTLVLSGACWAQDNADVAEGAKLYKRTCLACHANEAGQNKVGPALFGVVGRKAGSAPGFSYSQAMKTAGVTWDDATIDKYIADPRKFLPGNKMAYAGLKKGEERKEIIAYLKTLH
ncbi:MAG: cytochrome c family protein [Proteobacteria bacterium]|nr:cytochrome c family protein [Pseudomonadota bacterium]